MTGWLEWVVERCMNGVLSLIFCIGDALLIWLILWPILVRELGLPALNFNASLILRVIFFILVGDWRTAMPSKKTKEGG